MNETQVPTDTSPSSWPIAMVILIFGIIPVIYGIYLWFWKKPPETEEAKLSIFWRRFLWCAGFLFYGIFAIPATYMLSAPDDAIEVIGCIALYIVPFFYIWPSIKTYNLTNNGLLFLLGYDLCPLTKGIWFIPYFLSDFVMFMMSFKEFQFPDDSAGEEHGKIISISTGEHVVTVTDAEGQTKTSYRKPDETAEDEVLSKIIMLNVSMMVVFVFQDARKLFKNFTEAYRKGGETAVAKEIARQIRDHIVAEATALFPQYTAKAIFADMTNINTIIFEKIQHLVADWGIELKTAKLTTVNYDKKISDYLDEVVKANTDAIGHLLQTQKETKAYEMWTKVKQERAKLLAVDGGEKLQLILLLETAAEMAKGSTNYNIRGAGTLEDIFGKITSLLTSSK